MPGDPTNRSGTSTSSSLCWEYWHPEWAWCWCLWRLTRLFHPEDWRKSTDCNMLTFSLANNTVHVELPCRPLQTKKHILYPKDRKPQHSSTKTTQKHPNLSSSTQPLTSKTYPFSLAKRTGLWCRPSMCWVLWCWDESPRPNLPRSRWRPASRRDGLGGSSTGRRFVFFFLRVG